MVAIFAALKAGGVFVAINPTTKPARAESPAADLPRLCPELRLIVSSGEGSLFEAIQGPASSARPPRVNIDVDPACLIYTSGSTGEPKGVMSDHSNVVFASGSIIEYLENRESDIVIGVLPLSFDYGLYQLLMTFRFGGTLVLESSFAFANDVRDADAAGSEQV